MAAPNSWYGEDAFWRLFEPELFSPQRIARAMEEVDSLERLLPIEPGASILDLCCGTGRHRLELARRLPGYRRRPHARIYRESLRRRAGGPDSRLRRRGYA